MIQQQRKAWLEKALQPYLDDPSRRSISTNLADPTCMYRGPGGRKCIIGQFIPDEQYYTGLECLQVWQWEVLDVLPQEIVSLGSDFLREVQNLHDGSMYWNKTGLTETGREYLNQIIKEYCE